MIDVQRDSADEVVVELTPISQPKSSRTDLKGYSVDKQDECSSPDHPNKSARSKTRKPHPRGLLESSGNDWVSCSSYTENIISDCKYLF